MIITIIAPILNEKKHIGKYLNDFVAQDYPRKNIEIVFVDGGSSDGTVEILEKFLDCNVFLKSVLLIEPGKNVASAVNVGVRNSTGGIIIKMDVHTQYESDYISKCEEYLRIKDVDCVGGPMRPLGEDYISKAISLAYSTPFGSGGGKFHNESYEGYADSVYLGAYKREVFEKNGGWDENIMDADDDDFNYRLIKNGGKIFLTPKIKSYYYVRPNLKKLWNQYFIYSYSKIFFIKKNHVMISLPKIVPSLFVLVLVVSLLLGFISKFFFIMFFLILLIYLFFSFLISLRISIKKGFRYVFILPVIFATIHFSYGLGFLKGIFVSFYKKNAQ